MGQVDIIKDTIYLGNQLDNLDKKFDIYLKLYYKRREIGFNMDILSVRYNIKSDNILECWMYSFIISHAENNEGQFLQEFARTIIITDAFLRRVCLHHECRFQNRLFQYNVDEEIKSEQKKFKQEMIKRQIIFLDNEDLAVFPTPSIKMREFEVDAKFFRHTTCESTIGKQLPICYYIWCI